MAKSGVAAHLRRLQLILWGVAAIATAVFVVVWAEGASKARVATSGQPDVGGPFSLVDHTGEPVTDADFAGGHMLIYFGFATCPDVCPMSLGVMAQALELLGPRAEQVRPIFITVDPERDTPEVLADYLSFDDRFIGLTGTPEQIAAAAGAYKVYYSKVPLEDSELGYTMDHSSVFYFMGPDGRFLEPFTHQTAPEDMAAAIARRL